VGEAVLDMLDMFTSTGAAKTAAKERKETRARATAE
jgi:hypothetical protein